MKKASKTYRSGAALLVVLFVVMAITVLAAGFLNKSDVELACGQNMQIRTQMDSIARSALEHARGLILNPQDVSGLYWTGALRQQLVTGSSDFYDVDVVKTGGCDYTVSCQAYREQAGERIGKSSLTGKIRLNPCIAYWQGAAEDISSKVTVNGDVYYNGMLLNYGTINGDVYCSSSITNLFSGTITGKQNNFASAPISSLLVGYSDFTTYYYIGSTKYFVGIIALAELNGVTLGPTAANPAGIYYREGSLDLKGVVQINGTLVVRDDLRVNSGAKVIITAAKNFPALLVGNNLTYEASLTSLTIYGLAKINDHIDMKNRNGCSLSVTGALFVISDGIKNIFSSNVDITASPERAALQFWAAPGMPMRWSPAAGAFYKSVKR